MEFIIGLIVLIIIVSLKSVAQSSSSKGLKVSDNRMARKIGRRLSRRRW